MTIPMQQIRLKINLLPLFPRHAPTLPLQRLHQLIRLLLQHLLLSVILRYLLRFLSESVFADLASNVAVEACLAGLSS